MKLNVRPVTISQRAPEEQRRAPAAVGARHATREPQQTAEEDQRGRDEPGDLAADLAVEHAGDAGDAPHAGRRPRVPPPPTLPVSLPVMPTEAVVAEDEVQDAVVLRAADVRAVELLGHSVTIATHQPAETMIATPL